ncbi:MAG: UbiA family prenyltransferase [Chloroflexi bacterium]|nr:UbiA family prenyltransferase [Chloroflexota bacterium]
MSGQLLRRAQGYWLMIHPFPVMMVVTVATVLALATAHDAARYPRIAVAIAALFCSQAVVGISNDYHDRGLDAQAQQWKPLASGVVTPNEARALIAAAFVLMLGFAATLGPYVLALALAGTLAGLFYNFVLRGTPLSWLPYVLGFAVLPVYVWTTVERFDARQLALVPIGIPLLIGVHLAQTLPDLETDRALGGRGAAVTLGLDRGIAVVWTSVIGAQALGLLSALWLGSAPAIAFPAVGLSFGLAVVGIALCRHRPSSETLRVVFRLVAASAVVLAGGWLVALAAAGG